MRKCLFLLALLAQVCLLSVHAQSRWEVSDNSVTEIEPGEKNYYALREGFGVHSQGGCLSNAGGDKCAENVDASTIFNFIEVDKKVEDGVAYPVYVLKNLENGKYLAKPTGNFVSSLTKAYKFTARPAKELDASNDAYVTWTWDQYSQGVDAERCAGAEAAHAWVLCSVEERDYIGFYANPSFMGYVDTGHWLVLKATEIELSAFEKMIAVFDKYFVQGVDETVYPVGDAPGCVSQDLYDQLVAVYEEAMAATQNENLDPAECNRIRESIVAVFERYEKEVCRLTPGFFLVVNKRSMDAAYDAGSVAKCKENMAAPDKWNLDSTKYIWEVISAKEPGHFFFKNWGSGHYLGKAEDLSRPFPMVEDSVESFTTKQVSGVWFLWDGSNVGVHSDGGRSIVGWNGTDDGNLWMFTRVPADTISKLKVEVDQRQMNNKLAALVATASNIESAKFVSGLIPTGGYAAPQDAGLAKSLWAANASEQHEGSEAGLFDGNTSTYYHTSWHDDNAPEGYHWIKLDLGKEVSEIVVKMSKRRSNNNGTPKALLFTAPEGGMPSSGEWSNVLATVEDMVYAYTTPYPEGAKDSCTYMDTVKFETPARYVQMSVTKTVSDIKIGAEKNSGPFWHISELRIYDLKDCVENPKFLIVPQEIKEALNEALTQARVELENNAATQETYDALDRALKNFWDNYPDTDGLQQQLEEARAMAENAKEGTELGYFQVGAGAELLKTVEAVAKTIEEKEAAQGALTIAEIKALQKQLDEAVALFNTKLNVPAAGQLYRIVSVAGFDAEGNEEPQNDCCIATDNADYVNGNPFWAYRCREGVDERFNTLWLVEKTDKGFAFKNMANGLYMGNPYEGIAEEELEEAEVPSAVGFSKEPKSFTFESYSENTASPCFLLKMAKSQYVNLDPTGSVVHWADRNDSHAAFQFQAVGEDLTLEGCAYDVEANQVQIVTLPYEVSAVYTLGEDFTEDGAYEVIGKKDGKLQLKRFEGEIPAGTPFIISTVVDETRIDLDMAATNLEEVLNMEYVYNTIAKNGLVSAPVSFEIGAGFGLIADKKVVTTDEGELVAAGTGFFNKDIPETTEEGAFILEIEGEIVGEGTAVENVQVVANTAKDVYTIAGVKVRSNVKAGAATQNLPKGVYIIGGKKVIIK